MSLTRLEYGLPFPPGLLGNARLTLSGAVGGFAFNTAGTMDATAEKVTMAGQVYWQGAPTSAKTFGASSKIHFRTGSVTFADASTNLRIGIQDVITASGTVMTPDGTFDVYADIAGNSGTITSADDSVVKSITMTAGSKSIAHGDYVAVVWDMTARAGSDSVVISAISGYGQASHPVVMAYVTAWFLGSTALMPTVILEADDGTLGIIRGGSFASSSGSFDFQASTTPDENGLIFQVPFRCRADCLMVNMSSNSALADGNVNLYSDPLGTPVELASVAFLGEQGSGGTTETPWMFQLSSEVVLEPNTDYCVSVEATGTANVSLGYVVLADAAHRTVLGLNNCRHGTRSNGTGAFTEASTINIPIMAVMISALDNGTGMGNASLNIGL